MESFDLMNCPLSGLHLIEASAGTGKTYAVTGLFLRLIVERYLPVRKILAVTYTVAATQELKDRIRRTLHKARSILDGKPTEDGFLSAMMERLDDGPRRRMAMEALRSAIRDFDEAAIYTIHGFCQRMLLDHAFESGTLFDTEFLTDERRLREEITADFWRKHFYRASPELIIEEVLRCTKGPNDFLNLLKQVASRPNIRILPDGPGPSPAELQQIEKKFKKVFIELQKVWPSVREDVIAILNGSHLNRMEYGRKVRGYIGDMDGFAASDGSVQDIPDSLVRFTQSRISASGCRGGGAALHPFFAVCEEVHQQAEALKNMVASSLLFLKTEFLSTYRNEVTSRKLAQNVLSFDDLLLRMRDSLNGPGGDLLARNIGQLYEVALVDEFQDTDPIQYDIFKKIFSPRAIDKTMDNNPLLYLIGDPKQAIYGFRGADVFSYLQASKEADRKFSMAENWRSDPLLLEALNKLFDRSPDPFVFDGIKYRPVLAGRKDASEHLKIEGESEPPFHLWFIPSTLDPEAGGKPAAKTRIGRLIVRTVAAEIARLLHLGRTGQALIGGKAITEEDMAVLVRTNMEARIFRDALSELGIPSVLQVKENIFDTPEAFHMERLLMACAYTQRGDLIRTVLAQPFFSMGACSIDIFSQDSDGWEQWLETFQLYHEMWSNRGFMRMFRMFLNREHIRSHLLRFSDGERRMTNVLHLMEILHEAETRQKLTMTGLIKWLARQRSADIPRLEENEIRLERDSNAVKIVTIHKSKGLEYPIVFCPFSWGNANIDRRSVVFHEEVDERITWDLAGDNPAHLMLAMKESLSENIRLLYVALTRARHRCYLVWGRFNKSGTAAPAYLFHRKPGETVKEFLEAGNNRPGSMTDDEMLLDLISIADSASGAIALRELPALDPAPYHFIQADGEDLTSRIFKGRIDHSWKIASFTYLASQTTRHAEVPDRDIIGGASTIEPYDEMNEFSVDGSADGGSEIRQFPRGARAGLFFHDLLEHFDFQERDENRLSLLVREKINDHGYDQSWSHPVFEMLQKIIRIPLDGAGLTLSGISRTECLKELSFYFPLREIYPGVLQDLLTAAGSGTAGFTESMESLQFKPVRGFMRGFLDLVFRWENKFYLVDWKSNFLGVKKKDYSQEALLRAIRGSFYHLQYHLYVLALDQYLKLKSPGYDYENHFGGVYYFFLRGVDSDWGPDYGIYRDRPSLSCLTALRRGLLLMEGGA
ncbi:MAG: exodeoxyribonuclease V subunit beta [Syntrophales bacterium]